MKKRFATIAVAAVMTATSAFAFIGCGGDDAPSAPPDTFYTGTLSVDSYNSVSLAAQAFLSNEVCGDATAAKFESYITIIFLSLSFSIWSLARMATLPLPVS